MSRFQTLVIRALLILIRLHCDKNLVTSDALRKDISKFQHDAEAALEDAST